MHQKTSASAGAVTRRPAADYHVDLRFVSLEEVVAFLRDQNTRERHNHARAQAWFNHCARIRSNPRARIIPG